MTTSEIKVITETALEDVDERLSGSESAPPGDLFDLLRTRAQPIDELGEDEQPRLVLIDEHAGGTTLDLFAAIVRTVGTDRRRFSQLVEALMPVEDVASEGAIEQARRNAAARAAFLREFPSLTSAQVAELYGSTARNRAALAQSWLKQRRVFAVPTASGNRFPLFQFGAGAEPRPEVAKIIKLLASAGLTGWQVALWFTGRLASLDDQRPVDLLGVAPDRVIQAARTAAVPQ